MKGIIAESDGLNSGDGRVSRHGGGSHLDQRRKATRARPAAIIAAAGLGATIALIPPPNGLTPAAMRAVALLIWAIICWAGNLLDDYIVAMIMGLGWVVFRVVPFDVAFACFSTSTWWMIVGALGLGVAVAESGLLRRVALLILRVLPPTFIGQTAGLALAGIPLGPALPTVTGKTALAAPFVLGLSEAMGLEERSAHSTGLFMSMFVGFAVLGPLFLTGTVTNLLVLSLLPASVRSGITWFSWFLTYLPTMLIILVLSWLSILWVCRPKRVTMLSHEYLNEELATLGPMGREERITVITLAATILMWITGQWHGIDLASVAMAAVAFLGASGVIDRDSFQSKVSWTGLIFIGFTLNLTRVLPYVGLDTWLGPRVLPLFRPVIDRPVLFFPLLMLTVFLVRQFLISDFAVITIMVLILAPIAGAAGINPWTIGLATHLVVQSIWILPFQNDAYLVSNQASFWRLTDQRRAALLSVTTVAASMVAVVASLPWWRHLGLLPR